MMLDSDSGTIGFKHRTFAEYFYARAFIRDRSLVIDSRVFNIYWMNTFFFYLGLRRDCPEELRAICDMPTASELEEWLKVINLSNYMLAAYTTPYDVIVEGVERAAVTAAELYQKLSTKGSDSVFGTIPKMHVLYFLQLFIRFGYSYQFFDKAIEEAALRIDDSSLADEAKAYALFFLNVAYIDLGKTDSFDFMLERIQGKLPIDLGLALGHEGTKTKERSVLMRKQDRYLRRIRSENKALDSYVKDLYEEPVNTLVEKAARAGQRKKLREQRAKQPRPPGRR